MDCCCCCWLELYDWDEEVGYADEVYADDVLEFEGYVVAVLALEAAVVPDAAGDEEYELKAFAGCDWVWGEYCCACD